MYVIKIYIDFYETTYEKKETKMARVCANGRYKSNKRILNVEGCRDVCRNNRQIGLIPVVKKTPIITVEVV